MRVDTYMKGEPVRITGDVHHQYGYAGVIVGETRCFVDVWVVQLGRQLRVRKTSVQAAETVDQRGTRWAGQPMSSTKKPDEGDSMTLQVMGELMAVCKQLAELGVAAGDTNLHAIIDAGLKRGSETAAGERRKRVTKEKGQERNNNAR